jgi:phosphoribosylglycinamide formyltransferase 1
MKSKKIAVFASGKGSNAINIIEYFKSNKNIAVDCIICNKLDAPIVLEAQKRGISVIVCSNEEVEKSSYLKAICQKRKIDGIILAGFLRKIPEDLISTYTDKIINIHPSLLPKYGGQGMYGTKVHKAVIENKEKKSGITIHLVNQEYDKGRIIEQFEVKLQENETVESLQIKINNLELKHFPKVIEGFFK